MPKLRHIHKDLFHAKIRLYGSVGTLGENRKKAFHFSQNLGATSTSLIFPPYELNGAGRHLVVPHRHAAGLSCEGVVLHEPGQGVILSTRDCPAVIIVDRKNGLTGVLHAGRDSLMKYDAECPSCDTGVIEKMMSAMKLPSCEDVVAHITGGISAKNFPHKNDRLIAQIEGKFGPKVIRDKVDLKLDLTRIIRSILSKYGVKGEQVSTDGLCTFDTPWLGSKRAQDCGIPNKHQSNWVWVGHMI